jgi:hypothetical protein
MNGLPFIVQFSMFIKGLKNQIKFEMIMRFSKCFIKWKVDFVISFMNTFYDLDKIEILWNIDKLL